MVRSWCASPGGDYGVSFGRGEDGCFTLGHAWGFSNTSLYAYNVSSVVEGCVHGSDGFPARAHGDAYFCEGEDEYCIVCAAFGLGVEMDDWLGHNRWCNESDDLPFSLDGIERDRTGETAY
jgi:hypothetical protein